MIWLRNLRRGDQPGLGLTSSQGSLLEGAGQVRVTEGHVFAEAEVRETEKVENMMRLALKMEECTMRRGVQTVFKSRKSSPKL